MPKITKGLRIDDQVWSDFEKVVESQCMEPNAFAVVLIKTFADLRQGEALRALGSIPRECFKAKPGRKPLFDDNDVKAAVERARGAQASSAQDVA